MKKSILALILILIPAVFAVTIADYPTLYVNQGVFDAIYVIGEEAPSLDVVSATTLSTALARYNLSTAIGTARLDAEVPNIVYRNAIVIGNPCENKAAAILEGNPSPCYANLSGGIGYIKIFEQNNRTQILITGLEEEDRHAAAKFLATANTQNILAKEFQVASGSGSSVSAYLANFSIRTNKTIETNVTNQTTINQTITSLNQTNQVKQINQTKETIGKYDPIDRIPERKGFFAKFWAWLTGLFR